MARTSSRSNYPQLLLGEEYLCRGTSPGSSCGVDLDILSAMSKICENLPPMPLFSPQADKDVADKVVADKVMADKDVADKAGAQKCGEVLTGYINGPAADTAPAGENNDTLLKSVTPHVVNAEAKRERERPSIENSSAIFKSVAAEMKQSEDHSSPTVPTIPPPDKKWPEKSDTQKSSRDEDGGRREAEILAAIASEQESIGIPAGVYIVLHASPRVRPAPGSYTFAQWLGAVARGHVPRTTRAGLYLVLIEVFWPIFFGTTRRANILIASIRWKNILRKSAESC